ncbi:MAG TPA: T9SS type A sorting domain-containing protein, partial [Ignavibacteria bacterium]|nr:T9SS type A sorting domain-containing protein [Ignavibacteria bacterium]
MIRKAVSIAFFVLLFTSVSFSQPWHYDLGDSTRSFSTASTVSVTFMPIAPSGTARIRIGSTGGSFNLQKSSPPEFGSDSYLRITAPTTSSVNKFSVYDYTAGKLLTMKFKLRFGGTDGGSLTTSNGTWSFFAGNGNCFADNSGFTNADCFLGIQFVFGNSGAITINTRSGTSWPILGTPGSVIQQGMNYDVEIYANNSSTAQSYTHGGPQTVAPNKWDFWVNGALVGDELGKGALPGNTNIDSWMFYGELSTGNVANIFLDDIDYTNSISENPLPVNLSSFNMITSGRNVILNWSTSTEVNNSGFEIERKSSASGANNEWEQIGFVKGSGTVNISKEYVFEDRGLKTGEYSYRLKQIDFNGNYEYFEPQNNSTVKIHKPSEFAIQQNYPNPSNPESKIDFNLPFDGKVSLKVYDVSGKETAVLIDGYHIADFYSVRFDGSNLPSGVYFYRIIAESGTERFTKTLKM